MINTNEPRRPPAAGGNAMGVTATGSFYTRAPTDQETVRGQLRGLMNEGAPLDACVAVRLDLVATTAPGSRDNVAISTVRLAPA